MARGGTGSSVEDKVLVLAPHGRDASVALDLLRQHGLPARTCADLDDLVSKLQEGVGAVLITEEAIATADRTALVNWVSAQPKWSDMPFVVLSNGTRAPRTVHAAATIASLGNVVLLERPLHAETIAGALRSALKARKRQYEVRAFADTLERSVAERTRDLAAARESLEIALAAAGMGSWDLDLVNDTTRRTLRHDEIFGYSVLQSAWGLRIFLSHVSADERESVSASFNSALESGVLDLECSINAASGGKRWISIKGRVHYDEARRPIRMTGVVSDITSRREADARLAQAAKMDSIGQLTGGVAHDFNNLLTPIIGNLDLLRRRNIGDERVQRLIAGALQAAERGATLTQRLLAFARRQTLEPQAVDIGALVDGMVELVRRSLGPTVEIAVEIPRRLPAARVDPNQLELALLNIAINGRDAMPSGGKLTVRAELAESSFGALKPGSYIRLSVIDTGVGMDKRTQERAIEPFFTTKGLGQGTGLGLSMAHGLAAQSGGMLRLSSEPGRGTTVELWLPTAGETIQAGDVAAIEKTPARRAATVLLVDDEELVRAATADMLRDLGYVVVEASSGAQALSMLRSSLAAELLVTDYLMPGMSGAALIKELRASGLGVPSLLITGYANAGQDVPQDVPKLSKPFRQADLAARVDDLIQRGMWQSGARARLRSVD